MSYLVHCRSIVILTDNVVTCFKDIISAHHRIRETWHNPVANTYGPQVDPILLKSLFPILESMATEDVVNFYDRFHKLSTSHLLTVMPFKAIVLKNRVGGLCIPGLGTQHYVEMSRALMDFLPWLILGTLSLRINATFVAVHCKSNNGYYYFWQVLELMVPRFDPVVPILTPQCADLEDIFHFSQAYLLYFCLQAKIHYHFTDHVLSSVFLRAIQHSNYADTVTTLQSHVNLYCEDYNTQFLPPHLQLHGLAESIHSNAPACLRDIISPRVCCIDFGCSIMQGLPLATPYSPLINRLGCPKWNGIGFRDSNRNGGGAGYSRGVSDRKDRQDTFQRSPDARGLANRSCTTQGCPVAQSDCNRCPFLPNVSVPYANKLAMLPSIATC
jgi:hypothetical protein